MARLILVVAAALLFNLEPFTAGQEPATPPQPPTDSEGSASGARGHSSQSEAGSSTKTIKPLPSFLIIGTVFNEHALSFPGVQVRIRQVGEKKFKWQTYTNSRGEFAVRVFPGYEYEVVVHVKKYEDQTQNVDAKVDVQQRLSIKLEPQKAKTGAKP
jgi:Carboxypeptidase regulatory-like domain